MSHLANAIEQLLTEHTKTAAAVCHASGLTAAQLSRLRNGHQAWVSPGDLLSLATGICLDTHLSAVEAHARLLHARLQDDCTGPGAQFLRLELLSQIPSSTPVANPQPVLAPKAQANLDTIALHLATNRHVRDLIGTIANFCRQQPLLPVRRKKGFELL